MSDIEADVDFLFDETVIQNERLFNLEETTDAINADLVSVNDELEGTQLCRTDSTETIFSTNSNNSVSMTNCCHLSL